MSLMYTVGVPAPEAAYHLRKELGPLFNWEDRLADMRRGRINSGPILLPIKRIKRKGHFRPYYDPNDVTEFVDAYKRYDDRACASLETQTELILIDEDDRRSWKVQHLHPASLRNRAFHENPASRKFH